MQAEFLKLVSRFNSDIVWIVQVSAVNRWGGFTVPLQKKNSLTDSFLSKSLLSLA